jgi:hypothetical protein
MLPMAPSRANAEKLGFIARFKEIAVYDTNPLMRERNASAIIGTETTASLGYNKETTKTALKSGVSATRNQFNDSKFSSSDLHGFTGLKLDRKRWQISLDAVANYDTTRTSELTTFNLDIDSTRRASYSVTPSVSYSISPRNLIALSGGWNEIRYDDTSLTDYRVYSITPAFAHNISPKQQVQFSWLFNRYQSLDNTRQRVNTTGPSVSWTYVFRPYLSVKLSGSLLKTKYFGYATTAKQDDYTPTYASILNYTGNKHDLELSVVKSRQPYANGTESYLTTFAVRDKYKVNQSVSLNLGAQYQDAKQSLISTNNLETAWNVYAGASYMVSRDWDLTASYKHKEETLTNNNSSADQDMLRVGLSRDIHWY